MRTSIKLVSKITVCALLIPIGSIYAMEYGDMPESTGVPITSWLYNNISDSSEDVVKLIPVPEPRLGFFKKLFAAPVPVPVVVVAPALDVSKTAYLAIATGALTLWAARQMYNWMNSKTKNGE